MNEHHDEFDGFTLIELLIVIVILGILAAVVVFSIGAATDTAQQNTCAADYRTVLTAYEAYRAEFGGTPTMTDLVTGEWLEQPSEWYNADGSPITPGECA